jgi:hypothetical protein
MTTVSEMSEMQTHSKEWFKAAFEGVNVPDYIKVATAKICHAYNITGQSDPGYIANVINRYVTEKPTVCLASGTGEHSDCRLADGLTCQWCWGPKHQ